MDRILWLHTHSHICTFYDNRGHQSKVIFFLIYIVCFGFIDRTAEQRDPGWDPGPLQRGQSLCTWDTRSTHQAKRCPVK